MQQPEWTHLETFLILARTHRLAAAGKRLNVDHSTVSRHISALESALAVTLFDRREDGFSLTAEGERLFAAAEQMESLIADAHNDIVGHDLELTGTVRIGVPDGLGVDFLAARLARFAAEHRGLNIELLAFPRVFNLTRREADIAISLSRPAKGRLVGRKILDYTLQLYATREYLASHPPIRKPGDLTEHLMIGYIEELMSISELSYLPDIHASLTPGFASSTMVVQQQAVLAGAGVGVLPRFMAVDHSELEIVLPEQVKLTRSLWLGVHADLHRLTRVRVVSDFITEQMRAAAERFQ
ncbi:LysR family transcriptional regulator [Telmatobacter bradus]|uniref:LysR family transcriptional regulator n=1 Tax=Telmatobacter bradus TaxID=474953 RepID=UPI003B433B42